MPNQQVRLGTIYLDFIARNARFVSQLAQGANAMRRQQRAIRALRRDIRQFNRASRAMLAGLISLRTGLVGILGVGGLFGLSRVLVTMSDTMQLAAARVRVVARDTADFTAALGGLFAIAQETRTPLDALVDLYARVGRAVEFLGFNHKQILPFIQTVSKAIIVSGATQQEARAGLIQFSQGLAVAALRGDEFRSVAEQLPRLMLAIAQGLGTTLGPLRRAALDFGILSPDLVFFAINKSREVIAQEFTTIERTVGQSLTQVRNQLLFTVNQLNLTTSSSATLIAAIDRFREVIGRRSIVQGFTEALGNVVTVMALMLENAERIGHVFTVLFGVALAQSGIGRFIGNLTRVILYTGQWRVLLASTAGIFHRVFTSPASVLGFGRFTARLGRLAPLFTRINTVARSAFAGIIEGFRRMTGAARASAVATSTLVSPFVSARFQQRIRSFQQLRQDFAQPGVGRQTAYFARLANAARRAGVTLTRFATRARIATRSLFSMRTGAVAASVAFRTGFAVAVTGATIAVRVLIGAARTLRTVLSTIKILVLIEGVLALIKFIINLRRNVAAIGGDFGTAAKIAGVEFVLFLARQLAKIPGILYDILIKAKDAAVGVALSAGRAIGEAFIPFATARSARARAETTRPSAEEVLRGLAGVSPEELDEYRAAIAASIDSVRKDLLSLLGIRDEVERTITDTFEGGDFGGTVNLERAIENAQGQARNTLIKVAKELSNARRQIEDAVRSRARELDIRRASLGLSDRETQALEARADIEDKISEFIRRREAALRGAVRAEEISTERQRVTAPGGSAPDFLQYIAATNALAAARTEILTQETALEAAREEEARQLAVLNQAYQDYLEGLKEIEGLERIEKAIGLITKSFEDLTVAAISNFDNIGEAAQRLAKQLVDELLRVLILRPIFDALSGGLSGFLGVRQAAAGGYASGLTIVGERGPEIADFRSPARVTSTEDIRAAAAGGGAGGMTIVYAPVIESDNEAAVERGLARAYPIFEENIKNSVGADLGRPSLLRRRAGRR